IPLQTGHSLIQQGGWPAPLRHLKIAVHSHQVVARINQELFTILTKIVHLSAILCDVANADHRHTEVALNESSGLKRKPGLNTTKVSKARPQPARWEIEWALVVCYRVEYALPNKASVLHERRSVFGDCDCERVCRLVIERLTYQTPFHC